MVWILETDNKLQATARKMLNNSTLENIIDLVTQIVDKNEFILHMIEIIYLFERTQIDYHSKCITRLEQNAEQPILSNGSTLLVCEGENVCVCVCLSPIIACGCNTYVFTFAKSDRIYICLHLPGIQISPNPCVHDCISQPSSQPCCLRVLVGSELYSTLQRLNQSDSDDFCALQYPQQL